MTQAPAAISKIPTESPQPTPRRAASSPGRPRRAPTTGRSPALAVGTGRAATRGGGEVIELECGITIYPARSEGGRWRAVWYESDERRQCEAPTQEKLAAKLEMVKIRLEADAPNMRKPGGALIAHYLDPDRLPVQDRWSRKHAHTQRRLCLLYVAPIVDAVACQDIKTSHMQQIVNADPTAGEGDRVRRIQRVRAARNRPVHRVLRVEICRAGIQRGAPDGDDARRPSRPGDVRLPRRGAHAHHAVRHVR